MSAFASYPETDRQSDINEIRAGMTQKVTYLLAAALIARPNFPAKNSLPKLCSPAFHSFGHHSLLDYALLTRIVWEVVEEVKVKAEKYKKNVSRWGWACVILFLVAFGASVAVQTPALSAGAFVVLLVIYSLNVSYYTTKFQEDVGQIKSARIEQLLNMNWNEADTSITEIIKRDLGDVGDGKLGGNKIPVITITNDEQPFVGYGKLLTQDWFICRPKQTEDGKSAAIETIRSSVRKSIQDKVRSLNIEGTTVGDVVVVHGNTLSIDSPWLDKNKTPVLWMDKGELTQVDSRDAHASVRVYFATQVLFKTYMTTATFFTRVFWAGNSACCEVAVTTLGPLRANEDYLQSRLRKHHIEIEEKKSKRSEPGASITDEQKAIAYLRLVRLFARDAEPFQSPLNIYEVANLKITSEQEARGEEYKKECARIEEECAVWPGICYDASFNWREKNSLTFTTDFFGRSEAVASVTTLYDQISRAVLDTLDTLNFDISDYRDKDGKYAINAQKIEQIILGEKIQIGSPAGEPGASAQPTQQASKPAGQTRKSLREAGASSKEENSLSTRQAATGGANAS